MEMKLNENTPCFTATHKIPQLNPNPKQSLSLPHKHTHTHTNGLINIHRQTCTSRDARRQSHTHSSWRSVFRKTVLCEAEQKQGRIIYLSTGPVLSPLPSDRPGLKRSYDSRTGEERETERRRTERDPNGCGER